MKNKLQLIDLVRSFCILAVMAQHLGANYRPADGGGLAGFWTGFASKGAYGVSLFFVVSGFLITRLLDKDLGGLLKPRLKAFYTRRVARIAPLLLLVVAVGGGLLIALPAGPGIDMILRGGAVSFDAVFFLSIMTFTFNWLVVFKEFIFHQSFYGLYWVVLWSLSVEEQFYLVYPLVLKYIRPQSLLLALAPAAIGLGILSRGLVYWRDPSNFHLGLFNSFSGFEGIAFGALLYLASEKYKKALSRRKEMAVFFAGMGSAAFITAYALPLNPLGYVWEPTLLEAALFLFLLGGLHLDFFDSKWLQPLGYPGKLSYGMYLWHSLVLFMAGGLLGTLNTLPAFGLFVALTVGWASFSYYLFELPMNRWVRSLKR